MKTGSMPITKPSVVPATLPVALPCENSGWGLYGLEGEPFVSIVTSDAVDVLVFGTLPWSGSFAWGVGETVHMGMFVLDLFRAPAEVALSHFMAVINLVPETEYVYRILAHSDESPDLVYTGTFTMPVA